MKSQIKEFDNYTTTIRNITLQIFEYLNKTIVFNYQKVFKGQFSYDKK